VRERRRRIDSTHLTEVGTGGRCDQSDSPDEDIGAAYFLRRVALGDSGERESADDESDIEDQGSLTVELDGTVSDRGKLRTNRGGRLTPVSTIRGEREIILKSLSSCTSPKSAAVDRTALSVYWRPTYKNYLSVSRRFGEETVDSP
jgi:hypothetical protein